MKKIIDGNIDKYIFDPDNFNQSEVEEVLLSESLFGTPRLIVFKDLKTELEGLKSLLKQSPHQISIVDTKVKAPKVGAKSIFNPFAVSDALSDRDRKRLWLTFHEALKEGLVAEEVFWKLVWQTKTMLLVANSTSGDKLDLKPFVLSKAKQALKNWPTVELAKFFTALVTLYHTTYPESDDFAIGLEKLILNI